MHKISSENHRLCVCGKQFTTIGGLQDHIKAKEPEEEEVMDEREKEIREEAENAVNIIKASPWVSGPPTEFKLEDVCHLLSLIDNLRAELSVAQDWKQLALEASGEVQAQLDEIREAWEPILNAMLKEHNPRPANYMECNDLFDGSRDKGIIDRTVTAENITFGDLRKLAKLIKEKV